MQQKAPDGKKGTEAFSMQQKAPGKCLRPHFYDADKGPRKMPPSPFLLGLVHADGGGEGHFVAEVIGCGGIDDALAGGEGG